MKLGLHFRDALHSVSPWLVEELEQAYEAIRTSFLVEHDTNGRQRRAHLRAELMSDQTLSSGQITRVLVGRPDESSGDLSLDTDTGIATVKAVGVYACVGQVRFASDATGLRATYVYKNLARTAVSTEPAVNGDFTALQASDLIPCVVGDTLSLYAYQNSGGNLAAESANGDTFFRIVRVA